MDSTKQKVVNIGIVGIGGVGGYFGGKIAYACTTVKNMSVQTSFVARGKHLEEIKRNGLRLITDETPGILCRPTMATDNISEIPDIDIWLLCIKSYDLEHALKMIEPKVRPDALIIPLLNGVDIYDRIRSCFRKGIVLPSSVYIGTHIESPGIVVQKGGLCTIFLGKDPQNADYIPHDVFDIFKRSSIKYEWLEDPFITIWEKFIFVAPFALVSAFYRKSFGQIMEHTACKNSVRGIMGEIVKIVKQREIMLRQDIVAVSLQKASTFPYETKPSLLLDIEKYGSKNELDLFGGSIVRLGKSTHVATPVTTYFYEEIKKSLSPKR